jgi:hypothetical protein
VKASAPETESALPEIDARQIWKNDHEELGSYKLKGICMNCDSSSIGVFTKGYRPIDGSYVTHAKCPACGCDTMSWRGLAE